MNLKQAVMTRVSRRSYTREPLNEESMVQLLDAIEECNQSGNLHIQMVAEDPGPFAGLHAAFLMGVRNYFILAGRQDDINLDAKLGYYGESLVLLATQMGLGTCWVTETY